MSISVFKDVTELYPVSSQRPLTFLIPLAGGVKQTSFVAVLSGYSSGSILKAAPVGGDLYSSPPPYSMAIKLAGDSWRAVLPNNPYLLALTNQTSVAFSVQVTASALASPQTYLSTYIRLSILAGGTVHQSHDLECQIVQLDQRLQCRFRLLAPGRQLSATLPGFVFGTYRWRDENDTNEITLVPSNWTIDPQSIAAADFVSGIGYRQDLQLNRLYRSGHSVYPVIQDGAYFIGSSRYFCPSKDSYLEIWPASLLKLQLQASPVRQKPVFVGTYRTDNAGSYQGDTVYRYLGTGYGAPGAWDTDNPGYQYILDRAKNTVTLNQQAPGGTVYAGVVPETQTTTFYLPVYPVWFILAMYVGSPSNACIINSFDPVSGVANVTFPAGMTGMGITLEYVPGVAVLYEAAPVANPDPLGPQPGERMIAEVDLNPAFSGLSNGILYLMHRQLQAASITLSADKPRIYIPGSPSTDGVSDIAFGPVYYENDYALLLALVAGSSGEPLSGVELTVVPGANFQGYINGMDPTQSPAQTIISGSDGNAVMVYTPPQAYGFYLDPAASVTTTAITGDTFILPVPEPFEELWNVNQGWLMQTYLVYDDSPELGMIGANVLYGEVAWVTTGTPGTAGYKTNGLRQLWTGSGIAAMLPLQAFDSSGNPALVNGALNPSFSGVAATVQFAQAVPAGSTIGAYFIAFVGIVEIFVIETDSGLVSNSILLELAPPPMLNDQAPFSSYLYLNTATSVLQGRLNANRLGGQPIPLSVIFAPRY